MKTSEHDFVTVDMRGLKAALVARAQAMRVSISVVVREAVARELSVAQPLDELPAPISKVATVKLSIRLTADEVRQLDDGARATGLSRGGYIAGLVAGVPVLSAGESRAEHLTALIASNAEMSALSRNVHHLAALLRQGEVRAAQEYRQMLDTLAGDVRAHLKLAARSLAGVQTSRRRSSKHRYQDAGGVHVPSSEH